MGVRDGDRIEATDAPRPEDRRDDIVADVEVGGVGTGVGGVWTIGADNATGIDEQGFAVGRNHEQRISLTDVDR